MEKDTIIDTLTNLNLIPEKLITRRNKMIIVCCVCKKVQGEKEPFEDKTKTHGLCKACYKIKMKELENFDKGN